MDTNNYLQHHGVEGQKWGKQHGPPYPLDKNASVQAAKKKKRLPKTSFGLWLKNSKLTEEEYQQAIKKINRDRSVRDGVIHDAYQIEKAANYPNQWLNDAVKAMKNVDYIRAKIKGQVVAMPVHVEEDASSKIFSPLTAKERRELELYRAQLDGFGHSDFNIPSLQHSDMNEINDFLCHYGVLGMKWGHRKAAIAGLAGGIFGANRVRKTAKNTRKGIRNSAVAGTAAGIYGAHLFRKRLKTNKKRATRTALATGAAAIPVARRAGKIMRQNITGAIATGGLDPFRGTRKAVKKNIRRAVVAGAVAGAIKRHKNKKKNRAKHSDMNDPNYIQHFGRKGMKWGQHIFGDDSDLKKHGIHIDTETGSFSIKNQKIARELYNLQHSPVGSKNKEHAPRLEKIRKMQDEKMIRAFREYEKAYKKYHKTSCASHQDGKFKIAIDNSIPELKEKYWNFDSEFTKSTVLNNAMRTRVTKTLDGGQ